MSLYFDTPKVAFAEVGITMHVGSMLARLAESSLIIPSLSSSISLDLPLGEGDGAGEGESTVPRFLGELGPVGDIEIKESGILVRDLDLGDTGVSGGDEPADDVRPVIDLGDLALLL